MMKYLQVGGPLKVTEFIQTTIRASVCVLSTPPQLTGAVLDTETIYYRPYPKLIFCRGYYQVSWLKVGHGVAFYIDLMRFFFPSDIQKHRDKQTRETSFILLCYFLYFYFRILEEAVLTIFRRIAWSSTIIVKCV